MCTIHVKLMPYSSYTLIAILNYSYSQIFYKRRQASSPYQSAITTVCHLRASHKSKGKKTMRNLTLLLIATLAVAFTSAANNGDINIMINGQSQTKYVLSADWAKEFTRVNGSSITLSGGGRVYLGDSSSGTISLNSFYEMPLLGKRFTFDVDMSDVGCNCNGALYFVTMPAYNSAQQPAPGKDNEYYCDANQVGGIYCPEMDLMEANKFAMASTAHTCQYHAPHYYSSCDRGGCGKNVLDADGGGYGPGKRIDTNKPFTLSVSFITQNGRLSTVSNYFSQGSQSLKFDSCNPDYLQWMGMSLPGIVMTMSLWGTENGGMSWLDGKSGCQGGCNLDNSKVTFSNFRLDDL